MSDYISRDVAIIEFMDNDIDHIQAPNGKEAVQILSDIPAADVVPYSIDTDGTVTITVPKGTYKKINRVLVEEDGTHCGGLYYAD